MKHPISQRSFTASLLAKTYMSCYDRPSSLETNPTDHQEYPPSFVLILEPDSLAPQTFVFVVETSHSHKGKARKLFIILALPEMIKTTTANLSTSRTRQGFKQTDPTYLVHFGTCLLPSPSIPSSFASI